MFQPTSRCLIAGLLTVTAASAADIPATPTFNKDVLPVLQKNCQRCHRPGEIGPMLFLTFDSTRPWAKSIRAAVLSKKMPPWFADPKYGHFANEKTLSDADIAKIVAWVDAGAPEGDPKDKPEAVQWPDGWTVKPDIVFEMPKAYTVPKSGTVEYTYFVVPSGFTKDTWVVDGEVRPGNRAVVHHASVHVRPPGSQWLKDARPGEPFVPPPASGAPNPGVEVRNEWLLGYVPGVHGEYFDINHQAAKLIPPGPISSSRCTIRRTAGKRWGTAVRLVSCWQKLHRNSGS